MSLIRRQPPLKTRDFLFFSSTNVPLRLDTGKADMKNKIFIILV